MPKVDIEDIRRLMRECAGDSPILAGDIQDSHFADLGCDSLALLGMEARISQELGVAIPDRGLLEVETPRGAVEYVNNLLTKAV